MATNTMMQSSKLARGGHHRYAQAYTKNANRYYKKSAKTHEQKGVQMEMETRMKAAYQMMDRQDMAEQLQEQGESSKEARA